MIGPSVFLEIVICFETFLISVAITTAADVLEIVVSVDDILETCCMLGPSVFLKVVTYFETFMTSVAITTAANALKMVES